MAQIKLPEQYVKYFALFLIHWEDDGVIAGDPFLLRGTRSQSRNI